jgi:hypothetical protein
MGQLVQVDNTAMINVSDSVKIQLKIPNGNVHYISSPVTADPLSSIFIGYNFNYYNEPTGKYVRPSDATTMTQAKGYTLQMGTDPRFKPNSLITFWSKNSNNLNNGSITYNTSNTPGKGIGWNLVGNPYPCAIDWEAAAGWNCTNLSATIYFWTGTQYATYTKGTAISSNGGTQYISPMQGVYIWCTKATGQWGMDNQVRVVNSQPFWKKGASNSTNVSNQLSLVVSGNGYSDENIVAFRSDATQGFDANYDAYKLYSDIAAVPQLNSHSLENNQDLLAVNILPEAQLNQTTIPFDFTVGTAGSYTINAGNIASFNPDVNITLIDKKTGVKTNLQSDSYTFTSEAVQNDQRFDVTFSNSPTAIGEMNMNNALNIYTDKSQIVIRNKSNTTESMLITVYDVLGKEVASRQIQSNSEERIDMNKQAQAIYYVKVANANQSLTKKVCIIR